MLTVAVQVLLLVPMFSAVTAVLASFMLKSADEAHSVLIPVMVLESLPPVFTLKTTLVMACFMVNCTGP